MKKQEFKKNEERLRNLQDILKRSNMRIIGVPEEKEEEQKNGKLIVTNNEGELPQSGKGNRLPGSPGSSESPKEAGPKEAHTKAHHNYIPQDETVGEYLRNSKRKGDSYLQRSAHKIVS